MQEGGKELLNGQESSAYSGMAKRTWLRMVASGLAPQPVRIGMGLRPMVRWRKSDLDAWIAGGCQPVREIGGGR